ncbi:MAG: hypothetical protein SH868_17155 [Bythopirellula sp.]|nr:hypothetical protein [Bythopirellula sp.]
MLKRFDVRPETCYAALTISTLLLGCGAPAAKSSPSPDFPQLKVVGILAGQYLSSNNSRPPQKREDLIKFLDSIPNEWQGLGMKTAEEFLTSPRDGKPLVILVGKQFGALSPSGLPWVAYEQTGLGGKLLVINARGGVSEMPAEEVRTLFPES